MSKAKIGNLAFKIRQMKQGERFEVSSKRARIEACKAIKLLRSAGVLQFEVITRATDKPDVFAVIAL